MKSVCNSADCKLPYMNLGATAPNGQLHNSFGLKLIRIWIKGTKKASKIKSS